jgi:tetratricopeptide (TPR) repeat protein
MMKVFEFYQKYPNSRLMTLSDFEIIKPIEEEYGAYYASVQEPDLAKRGEMLIGFLQKYPQSTFKEIAEREYTVMLKAALQGKKYEQVEVLAEKWLKIHPDSKETYAFLAEAAMNLKHYDKDAESLEALYAMQPAPSLAREIHSAYQKAENLPKQLEWADKLFKMPEFAADYMLRYDYVSSFLSRKDLPKAAEYAQLALKSVALVDQPDAKTEEQLRQVRRACHHVIASDLMEKGSFAEAIEAFKQAIAAEKYGEGYYKIGQCLENLKQIEEAMLYYAKTALMGGEFADKAKTRLELLYKALHNDTLIGIDKIYNKAKELSGS